MKKELNLISVVFVLLIVFFCQFKLTIAEINPIEFTSPTPADTSTVTNNPEIKILTSDSLQHSVFNNINNSLAGWWKGESNTNDESGKGNNGTASGVTYSLAKFGQGFTFDGASNHYVAIPTSNDFSASGAALTISFWAKVPTNAPAITDGIGGDRAGNFGAYMITKTGNGYEWGIENDANNKICFDYWAANNTYGCTDFHVNDGQFHHYVAILDDIGGNYAFYIDGVLVIHGKNNGSAVTTNSPVLIGARSEKTGDFTFTGSIDDVLIFKRAFSENEVLSLYDASAHIYDQTLTDLPLGANTIKGYTTALDGTSNSTTEQTFNVEIPPSTPVATPGTGTYYYQQYVSLSATRATSIVYSLSTIPEEELCTGATASIYGGPMNVSIPQTMYVRACNAYGHTDTSFVYTRMNAPEKPTGARRLSGSYNNFVISWEPPTNDGGELLGYNVNFSEKNVNDGNFGYGVGNVTSYQFSSGIFKPGHTYEFTVTAYNTAGSSPDSDTFEYIFPEAASYTISSCLDLQNANNDKYGNYSLNKDLDCGETNTWNQGEGDYAGFLPIGDTTSRFEGTFDGHNHKIDGIYINRPYMDYVGLFGVVNEGASISNLNLINENITGQNNVGGLVGGLSGTVTNVKTAGSVNGQDSIGGLVGIHVPALGIGSSSPLVFTWDGSKYKFIGDVGRGIPRNIEGSDTMPIAGSNLRPRDGKYNMQIQEEYNEIVYYDELSLKTFDHAPGYSIATSLKRHDDNFYTVSDIPTNPLLSCVDMYNHNCLNDLMSMDDKWSYKDESNLNSWTMNFGDLSEAPRILLVVDAAENYSLKSAQTLRSVQVKNANGDWVTILDKNSLSAPAGAPRKQVIDLTGKFLTNNYEVRVSFDKTRVNYFAIDTFPQQSYVMNTYYPTKADLHFFGYTAVNKEFYWDHDYSQVSETPGEIFKVQSGNFTKYGDVAPLLQSTNNQFVIMHSGDQMTVDFDYVAPSSGLVRDFALYNWATFKHANMGLVGQTVNPLPYIGMPIYPDNNYPLTEENLEYLHDWNTRVIMGLNSNHGSTIIDSSSSAEVNGGYYVGGLVGYNEKLIKGSFSTGQVTPAYYYGGGLVGYQENTGIIENSYATGNVKGNTDYQYYGGLVGINYGTIQNAYATGDVIGNSYLGGLIGSDSPCGECGVGNSFSTGNVSGAEGALYLGGLIGSGGEFNYVEANNYWFNTTQIVGIGDGRDLSDQPIKVSNLDYFKGDVKDKNPFITYWDFTQKPIWYIQKNDYPKFSTEVIPLSKKHTSSGSRPIFLDNTATSKAIVTSVTPNTSVVAILSTISDIQKITQDLKFGMTNPDVKILQLFLIAQSKGPQAKALAIHGGTNYFGKLTKLALSEWQKANNITPNSGYFGPKTRTKIKDLNL